MRLRDSLLNMLGEFVGLYKTPDFKLNAQSSRAIAEAVAAESRQYSTVSVNFLPDTGYVHQRVFSTSSSYEGNGLVSMDPSYRRLSEPSAVPCVTPPKRRKLQKQLSADSQKMKNQKRRSVNSLLNAGVNAEEAVIAVYSDYGQRRHARRGSETFCGSVAAYSNNLSTINTRL